MDIFSCQSQFKTARWIKLWNSDNEIYAILGNGMSAQYYWTNFNLYNGSNTVLVDDSPYKSFLNSRYNTIFPASYNSLSTKDNYLDPKGNFVQYLEKLADADGVEEFIKQNPFGQLAIIRRDGMSTISSIGVSLNDKRLSG
ncbi:unnamed protein product [Coffea canephora]|uniref:FCP1 homology domain-containing protein n=1 Tax=Coffea canephora TaxID=49390 RepID=A0A068V9I2_COFCA|nr:unnamed protein product [Coffea canephora]